jgi:hypothetical protein
MPFKPNDPNINRAGLIPKTHKPSAKELKQKEIMSLLRKLKPLMSKSVNTAAKIIDSEDASESGKLRAATILLGLYKDLICEAYNHDIKAEDLVSDPQEIDTSKNAPIFSLTVLKPETEDKQEDS